MYYHLRRSSLSVLSRDRIDSAEAAAENSRRDKEVDDLLRPSSFPSFSLPFGQSTSEKQRYTTRKERQQERGKRRK